RSRTRGRRPGSVACCVPGAPTTARGTERHLVVAGTQFQTEPVRLLEVKADDLVVPGEGGAPRLEPVRESYMQPRAKLLRYRGVRDVADEDVVEPEGVVLWKERAVMPNELLAHKRDQRPADRGGRVVQQLAYSLAMEQAALDRAVLHDRALLRFEPIDARCQE